MTFHNDSIIFLGVLFCFLSPVRFSAVAIPSTLDGPFVPVTVSLDTSLRGKAIDLPETDPRVRRRVTGFEPDQISLSLSSDHDSIWVSWITGSFFHLLFITFSFTENYVICNPLQVISIYLVYIPSS